MPSPVISHRTTQNIEPQGFFAKIVEAGRIVEAEAAQNGV
jgi:hypothetical protein